MGVPRVYANGIYRDATPEEIAAWEQSIADTPAQEPTTEEPTTEATTETTTGGADRGAGGAAGGGKNLTRIGGVTYV